MGNEKKPISERTREILEETNRTIQEICRGNYIPAMSIPNVTVLYVYKNYPYIADASVRKK